MSSETDRLIDALAFWVCDDCMLARENDEWPDHEAAGFVPGESPWPWSLLTDSDDGQRVSPGSNVTNWVTHDEITDQITEGFEDFDASPCKGCGTKFAGSRWRYAEWPATS